MLHPVVPGAEAWASEGHGALADVGIAVVHGFSGNPVSTRPLGEALAREGFTVEVPRLPGHGTHWRRQARTRYPDWRVEVEAAFDRLAERCRAVVLVGLSAGGTLALDVASRRCRVGQVAPLAGVVTVNALILDRPDPLARLAPVLQYIIPYVPARLAGITRNDIARGGDEQAYPFISSRASYSLIRQLPRIRRALRHLTVPLLVAHSPQDHTVSPDNSRALPRLVGTDDVTELVLQRSYHVVTLDHDADVLADAVAGFARRVSAA